MYASTRGSAANPSCAGHGAWRMRLSRLGSHLKPGAGTLSRPAQLNRQFMECPRALEEELAFGLKPVVHVRAARAAAIQIDGVGPFRDVLVGWTPAVAGRLSP